VGNFLPQKLLKAGGEVILHLYCSESYFWTKAPRAFEPFGWLLAFTKVKAGWKAQPNTPLIKQLLSKFGNFWLIRFFLMIKIVSLCPLNFWVDSN
jgi:hypothetical protein